jgi:hypothetical protein
MRFWTTGTNPYRAAKHVLAKRTVRTTTVYLQQNALAIKFTHGGGAYHDRRTERLDIALAVSHGWSVNILTRL